MVFTLLFWVFLLVIANCKVSLCICQISHCSQCLKCDHFSDLGPLLGAPYQNNFEWMELYVGSPTNNDHNKEVLNNFDLTALSYFRRIVIENHLKDFTDRGTVGLSIGYKANLKTLIFNGNNIEHLKDGLFQNYKLDYFSLRNNRIQLVDKSVFWQTDAKVLDMSFNNISEINSPFEIAVIEELLLNNNEIFYIEPNSFPPSLVVLRLDHNNINHLDEDTLGGLKNLRELSISRNSFSHSFDISYLTSLENFDISHNQLISIRNSHFNGLAKLKYLNLENNKIKKFSFQPFLNKRVDIFLLLLANNQLSFVDIAAFSGNTSTKYKMTLYGNPWACICLTIMEAEMGKLNHVSVHECKAIESGSQPLCFKKNLPQTIAEPHLSQDTYGLHTKNCKETPVVLENDLIEFNKVNKKITNCSNDLYEKTFLLHIFNYGIVA